MYICPIVGALSRCLVAKLLLPSLEEVEKIRLVCSKLR